MDTKQTVKSSIDDAASRAKQMTDQAAGTAPSASGPLSVARPSAAGGQGGTRRRGTPLRPLRLTERGRFSANRELVSVCFFSASGGLDARRLHPPPRRAMMKLDSLEDLLVSEL